MYCAVHSPIPRILRNLAIASSIVPNGRKRFGSATAAAASSFNADRRAAGMPTSMDSATARRWASGNTCVNRGSLDEVTRHRFAVASDELLREPAGGGNTHLLAQNRPHRQLKTIPSARSAQAGTLRYERRQQRVERQVSVNRFDVRAQIEQAAHAADDCGQRLHARKTNGDAQALPLRQMRDLDASGKSIHPDGAQITSVLDHFDAGYRARPQEAEHGIPVIGRTIAQPQRHAGFGARRIR